VHACCQAATDVRDLPFAVRTRSDVDRAGVVLEWKSGSSSTADVAYEYIAEGRCAKLEEMRNSPLIRAALEVKGVFGIGPAQAFKLVQRGLDSVAALRARAAEDAAAGTPLATLTSAQLAGLRCCDDLRQRMPRCEVSALFQLVERTAQLVAPGCEAHAVGSYRRGAASSGDADILLTHADDEDAQDILDALMQRLVAMGVITDVLANSKSSGSAAQASGGGDGTWCHTAMCIARLPEDAAGADVPRPLLHRRLDLKACERACFLLRVRGADE
jgi:DNA polymerase/3'-5' exonuclease PolX